MWWVIVIVCIIAGGSDEKHTICIGNIYRVLKQLAIATTTP